MTKIKAYKTKEEKLYVYRITRDEWEKSRTKMIKELIYDPIFLKHYVICVANCATP